MDSAAAVVDGRGGGGWVDVLVIHRGINQNGKCVLSPIPTSLPITRVEYWEDVSHQRSE